VERGRGPARASAVCVHGSTAPEREPAPPSGGRLRTSAHAAGACRGARVPAWGRARGDDL